MVAELTDKHERWLFLVDNPIRHLLRPPKKFLSRFLSNRYVTADLGCGPGFFTLAMADCVGPMGRVYAVDSDEKSIRTLKSKASKLGYLNIKARFGSASDLSFIADASVDFVLGDGLLCCMADRDGGVKEIKRIMKPGSLAYLSVAKGFQPKAPLSLSKADWRRVLNEFKVVKEGESLTMRWAVVTPRK